MAHYVDNKKMLESLVKWREDRKKDPTARIPEYFGECILQIANHLSYKRNFANYTYREHMVLDSIENCVRCVGSFDPEKSSNPFAYFTLVIYRAFLRRIAKEKKRQSDLNSFILRSLPVDHFDIQDHDVDEDYRNSYVEFIQAHQNVENYPKKEPKEKVCPLDQFMGEEDA